MADWKSYLLTETQGTLYLVDPRVIVGVRETMDGHCVALLHNGSEVGIRLPAKTVMADVVPPPDPPLFVASLNPDNQTATLSGAADRGSIVNVRDGAQLIATATADADGKWETAPVGLAPGEHSLIATQTDLFGRESQPSPPCVLSVPEPAPPPPAPEPEPAPAPAPAPPEPPPTSGAGYVDPQAVTLVGGGAEASDPAPPEPAAQQSE